jgi:hypothetical protein
MTVIQLKRSSVAGRVPTAAQVAEGSLAINLADRKLYSKDAAGEVFQIGATAADPSAYFFLSATDGTTLYIGRLAWDDFPATGPAEDAEEWTIYRITTNSAGNVTAEQSATGAWSSKETLTYS